MKVVANQGNHRNALQADVQTFIQGNLIAALTSDSFNPSPRLLDTSVHLQSHNLNDNIHHRGVRGKTYVACFDHYKRQQHIPSDYHFSSVITSPSMGSLKDRRPPLEMSANNTIGGIGGTSQRWRKLSERYNLLEENILSWQQNLEHLSRRINEKNANNSRIQPFNGCNPIVLPASVST
jgi:hypothetical protein